MKVSTLMIATLLAALAGSIQAQTPAAAAAAPDPVVQMRLEKKEIDKIYSEKKKAVNKERDAKVKAAGDAAFAKPQGKEPSVARRDAVAKAKAATKADYDAKMKPIKKEHDEALAALYKKYPAAKP